MFYKVNTMLFSSLLNMITASLGRWIGGRWVGGSVGRWVSGRWSVGRWSVDLIKTHLKVCKMDNLMISSLKST